MDFVEQRNTTIPLLFKVQPNPAGLRDRYERRLLLQTRWVWDATTSMLLAMLIVATLLEGTAAV